MGEPGGIGPEVLVKALADDTLRKSARFRIHGLRSVIHRAAERAGIEPFWWRVERGSGIEPAGSEHDVLLIDTEPTLADPSVGARWAPDDSKLSGRLSFSFVDDAIAAAKLPPSHPLHAQAIVTMPISKASWNLAGHGRFPGHTELLAVRFGAKRVGMMFESPTLRVMLATAHLPLMEVRNVLTIGSVFDAIELAGEGCEQLGIVHPRIAVCGLNPHAGEGGLLGDEDERIIRPAIELAENAGHNASGPHPADTVYNAATAGKFDVVVAMYHDQGLIPVKLLHRDTAVNMTVGLGTPRTSPDHGTAYDIAGRNKADPGSATEALKLAVRLAKARGDAPRGGQL